MHSVWKSLLKKSHYSKIQFWQNFTIFSGNQSCQQLKSPKPQHFHEFFTKKKNRQLSREIIVEFLDKKWRFRTVWKWGTKSKRCQIKIERHFWWFSNTVYVLEYWIFQLHNMQIVHFSSFLLWVLSPNYFDGLLQVEGILQNTEGGVDVETIGNFEVPSLNTFDKSQPLDDLLIRRRSLHSSPANSR